MQIITHTKALFPYRRVWNTRQNHLLGYFSPTWLIPIFFIYWLREAARMARAVGAVRQRGGGGVGEGYAKNNKELQNRDGIRFWFAKSHHINRGQNYFSQYHYGILMLCAESFRSVNPLFFGHRSIGCPFFLWRRPRPRAQRQSGRRKPVTLKKRE